MALFFNAEQPVIMSFDDQQAAISISKQHPASCLACSHPCGNAYKSFVKRPLPVPFEVLTSPNRCWNKR